MRTQTSRIEARIKKYLCLMIILITLAGVTPVLADYLGPGNRTITESTGCKITLNECQYVAAKGDYRYHKDNEWNCSNESKPWQAYPSKPSSQGCYAGTVGDKYWERSESYRQVTYPPATISGVLQNCSLTNGWCITPPQLYLTGNEPMPGQVILAIEGTLNNQIFACSGSTCNVPLSEGNNNFTYWALSSWTDTSTMGSLTAKVDSQPPTITGTLSGTLGSNNWYKSPLVFNGSASDNTSGLAALTCALDGFSLGACNSIPINGEGSHTLLLTARDNAGLISNLTRNTSIDTRPPALDVSIDGTRKSGSAWYTEAVLNGSASDASPGSGLSTFEYKLDQGNWTTFPVSGELALPDGSHTVDLRATDNAGLTVNSSKSYSLDRIQPVVELYPAGTLGNGSWYITDLQLTAAGTDETSGVEVFEYSLDGSPWITYGSALVLADGIHAVSFWAEDTAGNVFQVNQSYKVDTRPPVIAGSLSGMPGENGWFISDVTLSASASDPEPGSGMETFTYSLDGSPEDSYSNPITLSDGGHIIQLNTRDNAGQTFNLEQRINVDRTPPSLGLQTTLPDWIKNDVTIQGTAGDGGSGLDRVEISTDGGHTWQMADGTTSWNYLWNTSGNPNGPYELTVRVVDRAGLAFVQELKTGVDNAAPQISLPESWFQWDTIALDILEEQSGLSEAYVEIRDPQGRWPARLVHIESAQFPMQFKWDRRFTDGTTAPPGTYDVKVSASDKLGNSSSKTASIRVLVDLLPPGPPATSIPPIKPSSIPPTQYPAAVTPTPAYQATETMVVRVFGSTLEPAATSTLLPNTTPVLRATPAPDRVADQFESVYAPELESTASTTQIESLSDAGAAQPAQSGSNILWGATAAAMLGSVTAYALEEKRRQQEEKARQDALEADEEERRQKIQDRKMAKAEAQRAQERAWEEAREAQEQQREARYQASMEARVLRREMEEEDARRAAEQRAIRERNEQKKRAEEEAKKTGDLQAGMAAYYNAMRQGEAAAVTPPKEKSTWEKFLDVIDEHQTEIALGIGVAVGVGAILLSGGLATPLVAAAWAVGAAAVAGTAVAAGTVALNVHYGREWHSNLLKNTAVAGGSALVVTGGWFLLQAGLAGAGAFCATNQAACSRGQAVLEALDTIDQLSLQAKLTYQTWRGDEENASQTALDLQMEYMDGGAPGNGLERALVGGVVANAAQYADDVLDVVGTYGMEGAQVLARYGDEAIELFGMYGEDAVQFVIKYGDDGFDALRQHGKDVIGLVEKKGDFALEVLKIVDLQAAQKLFNTVEDDVLDYAFQQGPEAVDALSLWPDDDLKQYGAELALRSKKDGKILADLRELISSGPVDPDNLTPKQQALINAIAENSTQYGDGKQVVLGKWVDRGSGFAKIAKDTGSVHYDPHGQFWEMYKELGESKDKVAWLVNQKVIQTGVEKGLPFEYSLNGIPDNKVSAEMNAIKAVFAGATSEEVVDILGAGYLPFRLMELQELHQAGYKYVFDEVTNSFILVLPEAR